MDVAIPTYRELMLPMLVAIDRLGGSASIAELEELVPRIATISDEEMAVIYPESSQMSGKSKVVSRMHWARVYLKKMGMLTNSTRGVWAITPRGQETLGLDAEEATQLIVEEDNRVRTEMRRARKDREAADAEENDGDDGKGDESDWKDVLLAAMKAMDPAGFERLSMRLLREAGFRNVEVLGRSGDGGIDGVGVYKVSLVSFPTYFQSKRYSGSVSAGTVRDFRGAMSGRGEKGLVITTGTFTPAAKAEATRDGAPPVDLVDGDQLCDLLKEYGLGVSVETRVVEDVTVHAEFFDGV